MLNSAFVILPCAAPMTNTKSGYHTPVMMAKKNPSLVFV